MKDLDKFVNGYLQMDVAGIVINCPYWSNRLKNGKVVLRGFANGKGSSEEIRQELVKKLNSLPSESRFELNPENLRKFAKRERIGIDCSGFIYRLLNELLRLGYGESGYKSLDALFDGGVSKTNVKRLTSLQYCDEVRSIGDIKLGDIIRLWGGKHATIILKNDKKEILYAHSSSLSTKIQGVHTSVIRIIDINKSLNGQQWMEEARTGENFGKKYFKPEQDDGVFRLKIFN